MNPCEQFPLGSRRRSICDGTSELSLDRANAFRVSWGMEPSQDAGGAAPVFVPPTTTGLVLHPSFTGTPPTISQSQNFAGVPFVSSGGCCGGGNPVINVELVGPGTRLIERFKSHGFEACQACYDLAAKMNSWGSAGCAARLGEIVADILPRALEWEKNKVGWLAKMIPNAVTESAIRAIVTSAIQPQKHFAVPSPHDTPQPSPASFTREPTRHLIYHIWPTRKSEAWKWNVAQLRSRIEMFDGLRIIGVALDPSTATIEQVQAEFDGVRVDHWIVNQNNPKIGEGVSFHPMLKLLPQDDDSITFYGHAKGVKHDAGKIGIIQRWTELMYRACLDNYSAVRESLESFPITGSMKRYGDFNQPDTGRWHYSGTFFWFRNGDVFRNPRWTRLIPFYGAIECWPSCLWTAAQTGCLIGDNVGGMYTESEVEKVEELIKSWPTDRVETSNGVSDRDFFDIEKALGYDSQHWGELVELHSRGAAVLVELGAKSVVEIGSGLGAFLVGAKAVGLSATGMGCSRFERDFAISKGISPESYHSATIEDYTLSTVDAVYCCEVFEHLSDERLDHLCRQLATSCKWLYFTSTPHASEDDERWGHINLKSRDGWIAFFARYEMEFVRDDQSVAEWGMVFRSALSRRDP